MRQLFLLQIHIPLECFFCLNPTLCDQQWWSADWSRIWKHQKFFNICPNSQFFPCKSRVILFHLHKSNSKPPKIQQIWPPKCKYWWLSKFFLVQWSVKVWTGSNSFASHRILGLCKHLSFHSLHPMCSLCRTYLQPWNRPHTCNRLLKKLCRFNLYNFMNKTHACCKLFHILLMILYSPCKCWETYLHLLILLHMATQTTQVRLSIDILVFKVRLVRLGWSHTFYKPNFSTHSCTNYRLLGHILQVHILLHV